ncbi:hypothetical protein PMIN06_004106 [Paraphaeosphaeria minitans]|uniref:Chaperone protein n=1 Tax=Paraphaeosphaeria minitans TaxID=565426 RepID=A0A9P6G6K1_9PLEO|nr:chaperone protein [Paraphaeosphaeria minitans]
MPRGSHAHQVEAEQRDLYTDLGVTKEATDAEVRRAFRELVLKVHPDKQGDAADFRKVHAAYEVPRDPAKRKRYDQQRDEDNGWANFIRRMQTDARAHREYEARMEKERADRKDAEQKRWEAAQEIREARAQDEKKLKMDREEATREKAIAQEDRLHEKHQDK